MNRSRSTEYEDAARVFPIARPVRDHVGYILDAESRQIARASPEYAVQIVHALNATATEDAIKEAYALGRRDAFREMQR